jgi:hypothetical protein
LIGLSVGALVTSIDGSNDNPFVGSGEGGFVGFAGSGVAGADSGVG